MIKYRQIFDEKNIAFQVQLFLRKRGRRGDYAFAMSGNYTKENVIRLKRILFPFILQINHIQFMDKEYGGVMIGRHLIME